MNTIHLLLDLFRLVKFLGVKQTIKYLRLKDKKDKLFTLKVKHYKEEFTLRGGTSDAWVFDMNIIRKEYSFFKSNREVKTILDAGANIGTGSRYFNNRYPNAEIVAVEPADDNFKILQKNTAQLPSITCLHAGVWSKNTKLKIINDSDWKYALRVQEDPINGNIQAYSIDGIMEKMGWDFIDLLKVDIEGSEMEILTNSLDAWAYKVGILIIELHPAIDSKGAGVLFKAFADRNFDLKYRGENIVLIFNDN